MKHKWEIQVKIIWAAGDNQLVENPQIDFGSMLLSGHRMLHMMMMMMMIVNVMWRSTMRMTTSVLVTIKGTIWWCDNNSNHDNGSLDRCNHQVDIYLILRCAKIFSQIYLWPRKWLHRAIELRKQPRTLSEKRGLLLSSTNLFSCFFCVLSAIVACLSLVNVEIIWALSILDCVFLPTESDLCL